MRAHVEPPPLTWLYVPADRPDRVEKALASQAHALIVDLEDGVLPDSKAAARVALADLLAERQAKRVLVRINGVATPWWRDDLEAIVPLAIDAVSVPKVETPDDVDTILAAAPDMPLHCLIESALGVEQAYAIAVHPGVSGVSLGEADLRGDLGAESDGLDWARSRLINAARAARLPRPPQSVYLHVGDSEGLAESCRHGRALGHLGRAAIHPEQLPVILSAYLPSEREAAEARQLIAEYDARGREGVGAFLLDGSFVDAAVVRSARETAALADAYGTRAVS